MTRYRRALAAALGVFMAVSLLAAPAALVFQSAHLARGYQLIQP